ncbi:MFS transporter [Nonomuraea sp. K274]|uniref:MFS transporter n=1 Tax=Nonomuraea cypriaca TaxID=1187855 RepID=A0A931AK62_9ACTN|nr:MFS transporter [Nonomuraea cypriaca]MBF8193230.1 MFS transporter [Nonomuraea cypriaca]
MPHVIRQPGVLGGTALAVFLAAVHVVNDAITAMLGALLPTLQARFELGPTVLALIVAVYSIASSVTQPVFGALAEDRSPRLVGATGVLLASLFLSLIGVAPVLAAVFVLLIIGGMGSAALHPVGTAIAGGPTVPNRVLGVGLFTAGGMIGFALGPVLILSAVSAFGIAVTPWLMAPGILLAVLVYLLLPDWQPHGRRPLRTLFQLRLLRGPIGGLTLAASLASVPFVTFTSSMPIWLVREHGLATDDGLIGWTLAAFSLAAGLGSLLGGVLAPRLGRRIVLVGSLVAAAAPLIAIVGLEPGGVPYFAAAALAGVLLYMSSPINVVIAQDLAPDAPATATGMVLGVSVAVAGALYVALGWLQEVVGLGTGMVIGFTLTIPAAVIALAVLWRHPETER